MVRVEGSVLAEFWRDWSTEGEILFGTLPGECEPLTLGEACERGGGDVQSPFRSQHQVVDYVQVGILSIISQDVGNNRIIQHSVARGTPEDVERLSRYRLLERFGQKARRSS